MVNFSKWCELTKESVGGHDLRVMTGRNAAREDGIQATVAVIPKHYFKEGYLESVACAFDALDKSEVSDFIRTSLPQKLEMRHGDIGEIYTVEWINEFGPGYHVPIYRLRWKDESQMAMRGIDVVGIHADPTTGDMKFIKAEAKCHECLKPQALKDAHSALDKNNGKLPEEALSYISRRLFDDGNIPLSKAFLQAAAKKKIGSQSVQHLIFTFSENSPKRPITTFLKDYDGSFKLLIVGLQVTNFAAFIKEIYERVIANASTP